MRVATKKGNIKAIFDNRIKSDTFTLQVPSGSVEIDKYQTQDVIECLENFDECMRKTGQIRGDL